MNPLLMQICQQIETEKRVVLHGNFVLVWRDGERVHAKYRERVEFQMGAGSNQGYWEEDNMPVECDGSFDYKGSVLDVDTGKWIKIADPALVREAIGGRTASWDCDELAHLYLITNVLEGGPKYVGVIERVKEPEPVPRLLQSRFIQTSEPEPFMNVYGSSWQSACYSA